MLLSNQDDILNWYTGERIFEYIEQGNVASVSDIFTAKEVTGMFDKVIIDDISLEEKIYALPLSCYQIGFYYHKHLFSNED
jgi:multiple sugar transport system substrate-binding protein